MSNRTPFTIAKGDLEAKCLPGTRDFISQNVDFFQQIMSEVKVALNEEGPMVIVSNEDQWNFGCRVDRTELGATAEAAGSLIEGGKCRFDEIIADLQA